MTYEGLVAKSLESGMPLKALKEVYDRGIGAWKTNPASVRLESGKKNYSTSRRGKMGKEQWAMARVNAFIEKRDTVFYGADDDIRRKYRVY